MPISVVVGGQFGSEGKGKIALEIARRTNAQIVVRVGGTNSGHTAIDKDGVTRALRQLPVSVLAPSAIAILPPGALIDPEIFKREVELLGLGCDRVIVSPYATVISESDKQSERAAGLVARIGSTGSGSGAALIRRIGRLHDTPILASEHATLRDYIGDTGEIMCRALKKDARIVIEGSQGYGLSLLHGGYYPKATSRDTTAGTFLGEAGLSPLDVDDVTLVLRCHPIRVAGDSGPLKGETSWEEIAKSAGLPKDYCELTTATKKVRRVGSFDPEPVRRAINVNNPSRVVLNHFDYVDAGVRNDVFSMRAKEFIERVEIAISRTIDWVGTGPAGLRDRDAIMRRSIHLKEIMPA
jgi:adenylosuccinate synthase